MSGAIEHIRPARPDDLDGIKRLYPRAFPDEDLLPLIGRLWNDTPDVLMLVAEAPDGLIGHIAFTPCSVDDGERDVAMLAPLAVDPDHQRQGIGGGLIEAGAAKLKSAGVTTVYVLGDPAYYGRHGFRTETDVAPPYPLPDEWRTAWQSRLLADSAALQGTLTVPPAWQEPALWGP